MNMRRSQTKESFVRGVCKKGIWPSWILEGLALEYEDEFVHMCKNMGYPMFKKKMDAATACAMWQESSVSRKSLRTILRYLAAEFGTRLVVPEA
jgi:hypothetical protein